MRMNIFFFNLKWWDSILLMMVWLFICIGKISQKGSTKEGSFGMGSEPLLGLEVLHSWLSRITFLLLILMLRRYDHRTCPVPPFLMIHPVVSYPLIVVSILILMLQQALNSISTSSGGIPFQVLWSLVRGSHRKGDGNPIKDRWLLKTKKSKSMTIWIIEPN